jgi:hypothetical protein
MMDVESDNELLTEIRDLLKKLVTKLVTEPAEFEKAKSEVIKQYLAARGRTYEDHRR